MIQLLFEPRDFWIGLYWTFKTDAIGRKLLLYLCLVPCFPVRIEVRLEGYDPHDVVVYSDLTDSVCDLIHWVSLFCPIVDRASWIEAGRLYPLFTFGSKAIADHFIWLLSSWEIRTSTEPFNDVPF
jgi:hypothetical protein